MAVQQLRIALKNCGIINPEDIGEYIAADGYMALCRVLSGTADQLIETITSSGLRGRGGGGFPTGKKWRFAADSKGDRKFVVCNADEGDPGAFMDRAILEGDPHSVLEAMAIAGYAIGASQGYIYVRAEYPLAIKRLKIAIEQATELGLLGTDIAGSGFSFSIAIKLGAGAFVCGEETALIHSIEGYRGEPLTRPPYPAVRGLLGCPTLVNNVETYANIPRILLNGADWFSAIGTAGSKGTKVFALAGNVKKTGLVEVPMGTTIREVVYGIGGGSSSSAPVKAVQTGGTSGGCIPAEHFDTPIDYETLKALDSMMGSGGMIVMDNSSCIVDTVRFYMDFCVDESCGKCTPCRIGNKRMYEMLESIAAGTAPEQVLDEIAYLAHVVKDTALCGLGQSSPNPVLSALKHFRSEFEEHVHERRCSTYRCRGLVRFEISDKCIGCGLCARKCPVKCIDGKKKEKHLVDVDHCIRCGKCFEVCKFAAVERITGGSR